MGERYASHFESIFWALFNNKQDDEFNSELCNSFKERNLTKQNIVEIFENRAFDEFQDAKAKVLTILSGKAKNCRELLELMREDKKIFNDEIFKLLLLIIHDNKSSPLNSEITIPIESGGHVQHMTMAELEQQFVEDMPDLLMTQTCVPELPTVDNEFLDCDHLAQRIKTSYDRELEKCLSEKQKDNPNLREEKVMKEAEKQSLADVKKSQDADTLNKRKAERSETIVQQAAVRAAKKYGIPMVALKGIKTHEQIGKYVEAFNIKCSRLKGIFENKKSPSEEVEHDVLCVTALPSKIVVTFIQVKTCESDLPWQFNQETKGVTKESSQIAHKQLLRDFIRFGELLPDISLEGKIDFQLRVATPHALTSSDNLDLIKEDFDDANGDNLLVKIGIPPCKSESKPSLSVCEDFIHIVGRYIGSHSTIPCKRASETFSHGVTDLGMATRSMDSAIESQVFDVPEIDNTPNEHLKYAITHDELTREIIGALRDNDYAKKFLKENPTTFVLKDLKQEKSSSPHVLSYKGMHPIFGQGLLNKVISIMDNNLCHQGAESIEKEFQKKKMEAFEWNGGVINVSESVKIHVERCDQCNLVAKWKNMDKSGRRLTEIEDSQIPEVLKFADQRHQGYREAHRQLNWCNFEQFEKKIQEYISQCSHCGNMRAQVLLSTEQRNALARRSPLTCVMGHYGSGKTFLGRLIAEREVEQFGRKRVIFASFSQSSNGSALRAQFEADFRQKENSELELYSRSEICNKYNIPDGNDNIRVITEIGEKIPSNSVLILDESPLCNELDPPSFDWSELRNPKPEDITMIICMQPLLQQPTLMSMQQTPILPPGVSVNLETQYRSTRRITEFNNNFFNGRLPLEYISVKNNASKTITGPSVHIFPFDEKMDILVLKVWLHYKLFSLNCRQEQLKILNTEDTIDMSNLIFFNSKYSPCISNIQDFQGCESEILVAFYSNEKTPLYGKLLEMTSRGKYQVILIVKDHPMLLRSMDSALIVNIDNAKELVQSLKEPHQYWIDTERPFGGIACQSGGEFPPAYKINSTGGVKDDHPYLLGLYTITAETYEGNPVYIIKHPTGKEWFMFVAQHEWLVHSKPNPDAGMMKAPKDSTSPLPPSSGWLYAPTHKVDSSASVMTVPGSDGYNISSSGPIQDKYPSALGLYRQELDRMYNDRPVFTHEDQAAYLFVNDYGYWVVYSKLSQYAVWFYSPTRSTLPPTTGWKVSTGFTSDPSLTVRGVW